MGQNISAIDDHENQTQDIKYFLKGPNPTFYFNEDEQKLAIKFLGSVNSAKETCNWISHNYKISYWKQDEVVIEIPSGDKLHFIKNDVVNLMHLHLLNIVEDSEKSGGFHLSTNSPMNVGSDREKFIHCGRMLNFKYEIEAMQIILENLPSNVEDIEKWNNCKKSINIMQEDLEKLCEILDTNYADNFNNPRTIWLLKKEIRNDDQ
jgi:hypothetical protein